jgi:lipopolysaccharide export LptBFGC system permease protein LptF
VFIRLANDNEVLACAASGISYWRLLAPVLALGLVLTAGMLFLSNSVVPKFFRLAERTVERDMISLLVSQLNQQSHVTFDEHGLVIYADRATRFPPQPVEDSVLPMSQLIQLEGVAVGETDENGRIRQDTTARTATLMVFGDGENEDAWVRLNLENVIRYDPATNGLSRVDTLQSRPIRVPSVIRDNPKFLSAADLDRYEQEPERLDIVRDDVRRLTSSMATESLRQAFIQFRDRAVLQGPLPGERYVLSAPRVEEEDEYLRLSSTEHKPVRVAFYHDGRIDGPPVRTYTARSALVRVRTTALNAEPSIDLSLEDVQVAGGGDGVTVGNRRVLFRQLAWPRFMPEDLESRTAEQLLAEARDPTYAASGAVASAAMTLRNVLSEMRGSITAQRHERAASAVSCALLLLLGAVLSLRLRGQPTLVVYFWSFLLAIVTLIIINSGVNLFRGGEASLAVGMLVLWSGNLLLVFVLADAYRRVSRH